MPRVLAKASWARGDTQQELTAVRSDARALGVLGAGWECTGRLLALTSAPGLLPLPF